MFMQRVQIELGLIWVCLYNPSPISAAVLVCFLVFTFFWEFSVHHILVSFVWFDRQPSMCLLCLSVPIVLIVTTCTSAGMPRRLPRSLSYKSCALTLWGCCTPPTHPPFFYWVSQLHFCLPLCALGSINMKICWKLQTPVMFLYPHLCKDLFLIVLDTVFVYVLDTNQGLIPVMEMRGGRGHLTWNLVVYCTTLEQEVQSMVLTTSCNQWITYR